MNRHLYPAYKPSGIDWLGSVPEGWSISKLGFHASVKARLGWRGLKADEYVDEGFIFLSTPNIKNRHIDFDDVNYITKERYLESPEIMLEVGDVLIAKDGSTLGTTNVVRNLPAPATVNSSIAVLRPKPSLNSSLLYWIMVCHYTQSVIQQVKDGQGVPHLFQADLRQFWIWLPSYEEQHTIATFLDRETTRIDALIEKKQKQIELLQEKRTALISHAVTKGLNPNATMKDSGIEWLGEIPGQWRIKRLRYLGYCQNGINIGAEYFGAGYPFVSYGDVFNNRELPDSVDGLVRSSASDRERYSVKAGNVFFTRTSETIEDIGFSSVCLNSIHDAVFAGFLIRFRPHGRDLDTVFSKFYFQNIFLRAFFVKEMNLVTRASLSQDLLKLMPVLIPPLEEQAQIASFLTRETARIDALIEKVEKSTTLLREYRTSLISAAVTGKIDVRKEAA